MTNSALSPTAQAVLDAYDDSPFAYNTGDRATCAAVLRAAAPLMALVQDHQQLIAIAAELEAMPID